jgi:hypothetical protein
MMATTKAEVIRLLDQCGVSHLPAPDEPIPILIKTAGEPILATATVYDRGSFVQFRTAGLLSAPESRCRRTLLTALLHASHQFKLVKFAWDERDGEVVAYVDLFLGEGRLTKGQVERCVQVFTAVVPQTRARCEQIVKTGRDPGGDGGPAEILGLLRDMLRTAMAERQAHGTAEPELPPPNKAKGPKKKPKGGLDDLFGDLLDGDAGK